jgi:hypothetical protein
VTTLAEMVARQGPLSPGQVVTVGVQIARELAALHAAGHVYAAVSAETIRIDADGRPALAPATDGGGQPVDDLRALVAALRAAAGPNAGLALLRVLGNPTDAAGFASELYDVCPPSPLFVAATPADRRRWPRLRLAGVLAALLVVAGSAGIEWAHAQTHRAATLVPEVAATSAPALPSALPTLSSAPSKENWFAVISRLDRVRDMAFSNGDEGALRGVYIPGSAALREDLASLRMLTARQAHARGLQLEISSVALLAQSSTTVTLRVVDRLPAYDLVDSAGHVLRHHAARDLQAWRVTLVHEADWRIKMIA